MRNSRGKNLRWSWNSWTTCSWSGVHEVQCNCMNYRKAKLQSRAKACSDECVLSEDKRNNWNCPLLSVPTTNTAVWEPSQKSSSFLLTFFSKYGNKCQLDFNFLFSSLSSWALFFSASWPDSSHFQGNWTTTVCLPSAVS